MPNPTKIENTIDDTITVIISAFAIAQIDKMNKGTFTMEDFKIMAEKTAIDIRKFFMQFKQSNLI